MKAAYGTQQNEYLSRSLIHLQPQKMILSRTEVVYISGKITVTSRPKMRDPGRKLANEVHVRKHEKNAT